MPELPEAEYMVRRLEEYVPAGARIARVEVLRAGVTRPQRPTELEALEGARLLSFGRRAKNVLLHCDNLLTLRVQLGMTGHIYWIPDASRPPSHTRLLLPLVMPRQRQATGAIAFQDARTFGRATVHGPQALVEALAEYGPEPLSESFTVGALEEALATTRLPIKAALLDQSRVAGLGNIWAAEALFHAGIAPERPANGLERAEYQRLQRAIRKTLERAIAGAFAATNGPEEFPEADLLQCAVYGKANQPCRKCKEPVRKSVLAGRATYFCGQCQR